MFKNGDAISSSSSARVAKSSGVSSASHNEFIGDQEHDLKHQKKLVRALERSRERAKAKISPETAKLAAELEVYRLRTRAASERKRKQENEARLEDLQNKRRAARQPSQPKKRTANAGPKLTADFSKFVGAIQNGRGEPAFSESAVVTALKTIGFLEEDFQKFNKEQRQLWHSKALKWLLSYEQEHYSGSRTNGKGRPKTARRSH
jgi:hypothetical protein